MKMFAVVFLFTSMILQVSAADISAQETKFKLKDSAEISDILKDRIGKRTIMRMQSGEDVEGTVVTVGESEVHVSQLAGKEFYDAAIRIDRISAVIMRMRSR